MPLANEPLSNYHRVGQTMTGGYSEDVDFLT